MHKKLSCMHTHTHTYTCTYTYLHKKKKHKTADCMGASYQTATHFSLRNSEDIPSSAYSNGMADMKHFYVCTSKFFLKSQEYKLQGPTPRRAHVAGPASGGVSTHLCWSSFTKYVACNLYMLLIMHTHTHTHNYVITTILRCAILLYMLLLTVSIFKYMHIYKN